MLNLSPPLQLRLGKWKRHERKNEAKVLRNCSLTPSTSDLFSRDTKSKKRQGREEGKVKKENFDGIVNLGVVTCASMVSVAWA